MTTFTSLLALVALVAALVALVSFVRHDRFAGAANRTPAYDELGALAFRRRPV